VHLRGTQIILAEAIALSYIFVMQRGVLLLTLLCVALSIGSPAQRVSKRKIPCKTPANAATCYWTHGRLSLYNGTPAFRLWKIGTHRVLGIYSGPPSERRHDLDNENPEFPVEVRQKFQPFQNQIFADFEVCPLEPERPHAMQAACIESAKNIVVKK